MSVLQSLEQTESSNNPVICDILLQMEDLRNKGFDILFCWVAGHTGMSWQTLLLNLHLSPSIVRFLCLMLQASSESMSIRCGDNCGICKNKTNYTP
ncbi:hypothetical protein AVEN_188814-1 [Araneus ventricosus]|uniref:RNase H type-1 domain-containing protein n=1 Tax=Araneus ventricosus TaxID=182803 RepID=A0A4Y2BTM5_ARAVE|nr:hypothetical protein AVEN_188814-1 [Araneus ventricosus]